LIYFVTLVFSVVRRENDLEGTMKPTVKLVAGARALLVAISGGEAEAKPVVSE